MRKQKYIIITKYAVYAVLLLGLFLLQNAPSSILDIRGIRPILLLPAAIALSMVEGEFVGGLYGAFAGLLCDFASFSLYGFNAVSSLVFCVLTGLAVIYLIRASYVNVLILTLIFMCLRGGLDFFFSYGMWRYEGWQTLFYGKAIPVAVYSSLVAPLFLWGFKGLFRYFDNV